MKAGAWGSKPGVGGPTDSSRVGDGAKRQPRDGMVPNMGARKPPNAGGGQRRGTSDSYQEELYTTKLDRSKITEEQARRAERIAREIEESSKSKNNRKFGEYEDRDDGDEAAPPQPAPPPPANNATTFPALGGGSAAPAPEPVKAQQPQSTQPPQSTAVDPAVLQMGPAANNAAPAQADKGQQEDRSGPPMTGGAPMNGPMQFLPGMQGRMMPAPGMAPPHAHMMQPGQAGMPGGWQGGSMNNQPPNAGMKNSGVAGGEGPSGMPSSDPMIMQQWQTQQAQQEMMMMRGQMHHMHNVIQTLTEDNNKLNTEKHHHYKTTDPNKDIRELEQKKGELHKEVLDLVGQKSNLEFMLMQMHHRMRLMGMHPGQMDKGSGVPMPGAPDYGMGMGGMPMDPMMMQQQQMQQMMMQQMMMQHMQGHSSQGPQMQPQMQQGQPMPQSQPMPPPPQQQQGAFTRRRNPQGSAPAAACCSRTRARSAHARWAVVASSTGPAHHASKPFAAQDATQRAQWAGAVRTLHLRARAHGGLVHAHGALFQRGILGTGARRLRWRCGVRPGYPTHGCPVQHLPGLSCHG
eukprot:Tamp_04475.p1 GENE.Tamp_04475~~Tamp_04475.p1  ORF type:complete len:573 (+),score=118.54 Tamp_04475:38-1756(+)